MREATIHSFDGHAITVLRTDPVAHKPYVTVVLPFGLRPTAAGDLFAGLSAQFNVVTWQCRTIIDRTASPDDEVAITPQMHAGDMVQVLRHLGIAETEVIGFCSGAGIALLVAAEHRALIHRLALVCGEYMLPAAVCAQTNFQREVDSLLPLAASSRKMAATLCEKLAAGKGKPETEFDADVALPFADPEYLYRHGVNYLTYRAVDFCDVARSVPHPTLFVSTANDKQVTVRSSEIIADLMVNRRQHITLPGDHYEILRGRADLVEPITTFLGAEAD